LPASSLSAIGEGLFLATEAAEAYIAMRSHIQTKSGHAMRLNAAYRTYAKQLYLYNGYVNGQAGFNLAAFPGTSNHGWGLAIDLGDPSDRRSVDSYGSPFGWSKAWSDAPGEWWHIKFNSTVWRQNKPKLADPFAVLLPDERRWLHEYIGLQASGSGPTRRRTLWRVLKRRRQDIWRQGQKTGWTVHDRRQRYHLILHYIGG
jgi:hypothetical protein